MKKIPQLPSYVNKGVDDACIGKLVIKELNLFNAIDRLNNLWLSDLRQRFLEEYEIDVAGSFFIGGEGEINCYFHPNFAKIDPDQVTGHSLRFKDSFERLAKMMKKAIEDLDC